MMRILLVFGIVVLSGCVQRSAFIQDRYVSAENMDVGSINKHAEVLSSKDSKDKPFFIPQESVDENYKKDSNIVVPKRRELTGYIVDSEYDSDTRLFYYTIQNALRTKELSFYSYQRLNFPPRQLVTVKLKDNFLESAKPYKVITKRKKSWIGVAKEYFIKVN